MNKVLYLISSLIIGFANVEAVVNYPFPTHVTYPTSVIFPSVAPNVMASQIETLYDEWKASYLRTVPYATNLMYVFYNEDGTSEPENAVAVSEGQGYGMLLAVYMAGYDPQAQTIFDSLFRFCLAFPSLITPSFLVGWQQVDEDGIIRYEPEGGDDSATDGDLDVAFALLLADKQWGSHGNINYLDYANTMMSSILDKEVNAEELTVKLGDWVEDDDEEYGTGTRLSDFMPNHFRNFAAASEDSRWHSVLDKGYSVANELFTNYAPSTGLLPDFSQLENGAYVPAERCYLEGIRDGDYSWNACRTPWRIATDYILSGDTRAIPQLTVLNSWIQRETHGLASDVNAGYELNGTMLPDDEGEFYDDLAFTTPMAVSAMINSTNQVWLDALWDYTTSYPSEDANYFANTLRLLSLLVVSGNWWTPLNLP